MALSPILSYSLQFNDNKRVVGSLSYLPVLVLTSPKLHLTELFSLMPLNSLALAPKLNAKKDNFDGH